MDIHFSEQDRQFRDEVRAFLREAWTPELEQAMRNPKTFPDAERSWEKKLSAKGWLAPNWPVEHGGAGWTPTQFYIWESERGTHGASDISPFGVKMVGPVIYTFGTEEQKQRFLPRILEVEDWWCQGYSEPGAGSDLASLKTRAVLEGDEYVVSGSKIWTTYAQYADWIFCLVRTDSSGKKQEGITFLLIDMKSPGVRVSPIIGIDNEHTLNEVFFDEVRVPVANRIGEQDKGWTYAKALLQHERTAITQLSDSRRTLERARRLAAEEVSGGIRLLDEPLFRKRLADVEVELMALEYTELRVLAKLSAGSAPGAESSMLKIKGTELQQATQELMMDVAGHYQGVLQGELSSEELGHEFGDNARKRYMYGRAATVYGGSNEIQKNIMAKAVLGL